VRGVDGENENATAPIRRQEGVRIVCLRSFYSVGFIDVGVIWRSV